MSLTSTHATASDAAAGSRSMLQNVTGNPVLIPSLIRSMLGTPVFLEGRAGILDALGGRVPREAAREPAVLSVGGGDGCYHCPLTYPGSGDFPVVPNSDATFRSHNGSAAGHKASCEGVVNGSRLRLGSGLAGTRQSARVAGCIATWVMKFAVHAVVSVKSVFLNNVADTVIDIPVVTPLSA